MPPSCSDINDRLLRRDIVSYSTSSNASIGTAFLYMDRSSSTLLSEAGSDEYISPSK